MKDVPDPQKVIGRLGLAWVYYDTSEKGWHIFTQVPYVDTVIIGKIMRAFGATGWPAEADLSESGLMRVCIR